MASVKYNYLNKEKKTVKFNLLLKPSISEKLDELVDEGKIRSKGDLINSLLEEFINNLD